MLWAQRLFPTQILRFRRFLYGDSTPSPIKLKRRILRYFFGEFYFCISANLAQTHSPSPHTPFSGIGSPALTSKNMRSRKNQKIQSYHNRENITPRPDRGRPRSAHFRWGREFDVEEWSGDRITLPSSVQAVSVVFWRGDVLSAVSVMTGSVVSMFVNVFLAIPSLPYATWSAYPDVYWMLKKSWIVILKSLTSGDVIPQLVDLMSQYCWVGKMDVEKTEKNGEWYFRGFQGVFS